MPLDVTSATLDVSEDQTTLIDANELAWNAGVAFSPFSSTFRTAVLNISHASPADFTPQIAVETGLFTLNPPANGGIKDLKLTSNANGDPYPAAGIDSGMTTDDGTHIWLFKGDADSNTVKGVIGSDPNGQAAFVVALDETVSGGNVTAAKLWIIQYAPVFHSGHNLTDTDITNALTNKIFVSTTEQSSSIFSDFSDVPSGSPLFAMIAPDTGTPGANQVDYLVTAFDGSTPAISVNVSSQGSFPGSLASGSQNITPGTGLRFDLVKGGTLNYTKQAGQSGAGIAYSDGDPATLNDHAQVTSAGFSIVQNQGGRGTDLRLDAYMVGTTERSAQGTSFITNLSDQTHTVITSVRVYIIDPATGLPLVVNGVQQILFDNTPGANTPSTAQVDMNADGSVTVHGMKLNWTVEINGNAQGFDRFTATNVSSVSNAYVDIGRLTTSVLKDSADNDEIGSHIHIHDSGPTIAVSNATLATWLTDESALATGNPALKVAGDSTTDTHNVSADFDKAFGADGPLGGTAAAGTAYQMLISANAADTGLHDSVTGDSILLRINGGVVEGYLALHTSSVAFTVGVASNGDVTLTQLRSIQEGNTASANETISMANANLIKVQATVTDSEGTTNGDQASASIAIADHLNFRDDGPSISPTGSAPTLTVDESGLATGSLSGQPTLATATGNVAANFTNVAGADGASGNIAYALNATEGTATGLTDTATNTAVTIHLSGASVQGVNSTGQVVFTVTINASTGAVTLTQSRAVVHLPDSGPDQGITLAANIINVTATITDGDSDTATATKSISDGMTFKDDGPSISATGTFGNLTTDESALASGNGEVGASITATSGVFTNLFNAVNGADGATTAYKLDVDTATPTGLTDTLTGQSIVLSKISNTEVRGVLSGDATKIAFTVILNADNTVTLTQGRSIVHANAANPDDSKSMPADLIKLTATITDSDNDAGSASQSISNHLLFEDDGPKITAGTVTQTMAVNDAVLNSAATASFASLFTPAYGADGALGGAPATTYDLNTAGGDSGLKDVQTGQSVLLEKVGANVVGYILQGAVHTTVFTVSVNSGGTVSLSQARAIQHETGSPPVQSDATLSMTSTLITLSATIKDGDSDPATATANIGATFQFNDAHPEFTTQPTAINMKFASGETGTTTFAADFHNDLPGSVVFDQGSLVYTGPYTPKFSLDGKTVEFDDSAGHSVYHATIGASGVTVTADQTPLGTEQPLNFNAIASGGPKETLDVPLMDGSDSIHFDGLIFVNTANPAAAANNPGAASTNDDLNPDSVGFGVKGGQASQINPNEGFTFETDSGSALDHLKFDIAGIGNVKTVTVDYWLYDASNVQIGHETKTVTLPSGNKTTPFLVVDDVTHKAFDHAFVDFTFGNQGTNVGVRILDFAAQTTTPPDPDSFSIDLIATDGDLDHVTSSLFKTTLDPAGFV